MPIFETTLPFCKEKPVFFSECLYFPLTLYFALKLAFLSFLFIRIVVFLTFPFIPIIYEKRYISNSYGVEGF